MTIFLPGPTTLAVILWASIKIVNRVGHSWTGDANSGGVPTFVTPMVLLMRELYADYTGIPILRQHSCFSAWECLSLSWLSFANTSSLTSLWLAKLRAKSHEKSCKLTVIGSSSALNNPNEGILDFEDFSTDWGIPVGLWLFLERPLRNDCDPWC